MYLHDLNGYIGTDYSLSIKANSAKLPNLICTGCALRSECHHYRNCLLKTSSKYVLMYMYLHNYWNNYLYTQKYINMYMLTCFKKMSANFGGCWLKASMSFSSDLYLSSSEY